MFQRLSNLLFGEVEDVSAEVNGPKPCVTETDEEGWLLVSVPDDGDCTTLGEDGAEVPSIAQSLPYKGAPAEASPMEDLLIEHPSMSVYVSSSNLEQSTTDVADGASRMSESVPSPVPTRLARGSACQAAPLAKVTHASRVQKAKSRVERRHLARGRVQRQNRVRQQVPRHAAHMRNSFLHQPCQRGLCH